MSRAASSVDTWRVRSPLSSRQPCPNPRISRSLRRASRRSSGSGSDAMNSSRASSLRQSMGVLLPTPRGSNPTMSKEFSTGSPK